MARHVRGAGKYTISVEGLDDLVRGFSRMSKDLRKKLQARLKDAAEIVKDEGVRVAHEVGLAPPGKSGRGKGKLVRGIRAFATGSTAGVRDNVNRGGYAYPREYEYKDGGVRGFLEPALEHKTKEVEARLEDMLADVAREGGF